MKNLAFISCMLCVSACNSLSKMHKQDSGYAYYFGNDSWRCKSSLTYPKQQIEEYVITDILFDKNLNFKSTYKIIYYQLGSNNILAQYSYNRIGKVETINDEKFNISSKYSGQINKDFVKNNFFGSTYFKFLKLNLSRNAFNKRTLTFKEKKAYTMVLMEEKLQKAITCKALLGGESIK